MMPKMDGWEVLRRLRKEADTPVLFLTARDNIADRINGLGLSIVATIMQLHNGRYSVSSEDGVTCFELFFPGRQA